MKSPAGLALVLTSLLAAASIAAAAEHVPNPNPTDYPDDAAYPAQKIVRAGRLDVDVWINKDEGGVYRPGESMRVYFRSTGDGYVLVFNVDTEGYIHLIYPYGPEDPPYVDGGRAYRIPSRSDPYDLVADGPPGIEYVVAVASPFPFQNLPWYLSADRADGERPDLEDDDDDTESGQIQGDPYVGIDRIIRRIVPQGREDRVSTNETYFYIGRRVDYPRYVCADCHFHPFYFDPYVDACSAFEIRVDATWAHYAPIRFGSVRPRYIYRVRPGAPTRYRQWKQQWSSLDGRATLRTRFLPDRDIRNRRDRAPQPRPNRPEFRDLRRYREGRIWRGRDEILRLRENRDRVNPPDGQGQRDRGRSPQGTPPDNRDRGGRGWWWQRGDQKGDRRAPEERRAPDQQRQRPEPERNRGDQGHRDDHKDQGNRDDHKDQGNRDDHKDQGNRDRGDHGNRDRGDRGDRGDQGGERRR
jgi:hypothetical protein